MIWLVVGLIVVVLGIGALVLSRRRRADGVTTFRRHIDALSSEARRGVVDRVQRLDEDSPGKERPGEGRGVDGA